MFSCSDNKDIKMSEETDKIIEKLFKSLLKEYQKVLGKIGR